MFGRTKKQENQFIIAVKDLSDTEKALKAETISLPFEKSLYRDMISTQSKKVDSLKDLKKFIRLHKKNKAEVLHYWEGLIVQGYTLMTVNYDGNNPTIDRLCDTGKFKLICRV